MNYTEDKWYVLGSDSSAKLQAKYADIVEDQIRKDDIAFLQSCGISGEAR